MRERFDEIVESVLAELPKSIHTMLEESPLIVEDFPTDDFMRSLDMDPQDEDLCGLHSGSALTERSVSASGELPETIQIFRRGILDAAGDGMSRSTKMANPWAANLPSSAKSASRFFTKLAIILDFPKKTWIDWVMDEVTRNYARVIPFVSCNEL